MVEPGVKVKKGELFMKKLCSMILSLILVLDFITPVSAATTQTYTDIKSRDYYYDAALWTRQDNIIPGVSKAKFAPTKQCTNAQIITALWRAFGKPAVKSVKNPFTDVKKTDSCYKPVLWAVKQGILPNTAKSKFYPTKKCTNAKTITYLWRAFGKPAASVKGTVAKRYAKSKYYRTAVAWADRNGLFTLQCKTFNPGAVTTRADIAVYLYLALDKDVKTPTEALADMSGWGMNISDILMDNEPDPLNPDDTIGYATTRPMTEPFGLALNYWNGGFEWIAYHEPHEKSFTASASIPDYEGKKSWVDWVDALFFAEIFTNVPDKSVKVTLKDTRIVLADGSFVPLSVMDGKYSLVTGSDADLNGWYRAELKFDRSKLPAPSTKFNGAKIETTLISDMSFQSPQDKADYYIQLCHMKYDPIKATNNILDQGTNIVRLPVTWTPFVNDTTFEIDEVWLERVAEEVGYILQNNAYCILDLHNDYLGKSFVGDHWETRWMDARYKDYVDRRFAAIWQQIATYFKNYPRKLMFETCNEPTMSWYDGVEEGYFEGQRSRVNELNELFVETVRATGGKNTDRILNVVAAEYSTAKTLESMTPPQDDNLIMQVHSYDQIEARESGFDSKAETDKFFAAIDAFVSRTGIPVMIGETGVSHLKPEETYLSEISYFFRQARQRNIPVLWWEDYYSINEYNKDDLEHLGRIYWLYNKETDKWQRGKILRTIKDAVK